MAADPLTRQRSGRGPEGALTPLRRSLPMVRSALGLCLLLGWVLLPDQREAVLTGFAASLVALTAAELVVAAGLQPRGRPPALVRALAPAAGAGVLLLGQGDTSRAAPAAGALLVVRGIADLLAALRVGRLVGGRSWLLALGAGQLLVGTTSVVLAEVFGQAGVVLLGLAWLSGGPVAFLAGQGSRAAPLTTAPMPGAGAMTAAERRALAGEVYFRGEDLRPRLVRFVVLLTVATTIATYGVLSGSVAAVIGAMIVAPLMLPMQALTVALVSGAAAQARTAVAVLLGGVLLVLVLSTFLASTFRDLDVVLLNDQVTSRTSPALTDLAVALAAGAAGGFALLRKDVADSLPGVAVAVSLVPPLCVSGALVAGGEAREATGAFLLFVVNFVAIVLANGAVLILGGFGPPEPGSDQRLLTWGAGFGVALVALAVPLGVTGLDTLREESLERTVRTELVGWLGSDQPAELLDLTVDGDHVTLLLASADRPPSPDDLQREVSDATGRPIRIEVQWVRAERVG